MIRFHMLIIQFLKFGPLYTQTKNISFGFLFIIHRALQIALSWFVYRLIGPGSMNFKSYLRIILILENCLHMGRVLVRLVFTKI